MAKTRTSLFPIALTPESTANGPAELIREIIAESDRQVAEKSLGDEEAVDEFRMGCDALNCWRMNMRLVEEAGGEPNKKSRAAFEEMWRGVAKRRDYPEDDFLSALDATRDRARLPWGFTSLRLALARTQRNPIRLLKAGLKDAPLPTLIAGMAFELTQLNKPGEPLLLPVDNIRALLEQRKLVIGGAINRLVDGGIIQQTGKKYGTGRAREFKFIAKKGEDFELVEN